MRRFALYTAAAVVLLSMLVTTLKITSRPAAMPCPRCGLTGLQEAKKPERTVYLCRVCAHQFEGPARQDFLWMGAVEHWLGE